MYETCETDSINIVPFTYIKVTNTVLHRTGLRNVPGQRTGLESRRSAATTEQTV